MTADLRSPDDALAPKSAAALAALPFVRGRGDGAGSDLWAVTPTGNWQTDYATGRAYAVLALGVMADHGAPLLGAVGEAMRRTGREADGIASGFLNAMGQQAIAGEKLRRVAATYAPDRASAPVDPLSAPCLANSPVMRTYREWKARYDWIESPATDAQRDDDLNTAQAQRDDIEARLFALPCETPRDALAKLVAYALGGFDLSSGGDWSDRLLGEALAALGDDATQPLPSEAIDPLPGMVEEWRAVAAEVNSGALTGFAAEVKEAQLLSLDATIQAMQPRSLAGAAALLRFAKEVHALEDHTPGGCDIIGAVVALLEEQPHR